MNPVKEVSRDDEIRKLAQSMNESGDLSLADEMIKDNKIEFFLNDKTYRVRLLTLREKEELEYLRIKKFGQLLQDKDILLEADLIKLYEERGISIKELDEKIRKIDIEINDRQLSLGEAIANNEGEAILKTYHSEIIALVLDKQVFFLQKTNLLEYSLENQLLSYIAQIVSYLSTEVKEKDEWVRLWGTLEDFTKCNDEALINKIATLSMTLQAHS